MKEIQLEVGKSYEVRDPTWVIKRGNSAVIKIIDYRQGLERPFFGENKCRFTENGRAWPRGGQVAYDLVREVPTN